MTAPAERVPGRPRATPPATGTPAQRATQRLPARWQALLFNPWLQLALALLGPLGAVLVASQLVNAGRYGGWLFYYYMAMILAPFVTYLFDRLEYGPRLPRAHWLVEVPVIVLAAARAFTPVPLVSGHAIFATYALLTTHTRQARLLALTALVQTVAFKIVVGDPTVIGGLVVGAGAAWLVRRVGRGERVREHNARSSAKALK